MKVIRIDDSKRAELKAIGLTDDQIQAVISKAVVESTAREGSGLSGILRKNNAVVTVTNDGKTKTKLNMESAVRYTPAITEAANAITALLSSQNLAYMAKSGKGAESVFNPNLIAFIVKYNEIVGERVTHFLNTYYAEMNRLAVQAKTKKECDRLCKSIDSVS